MSANNSFSESNNLNDSSLAAQYALRVALQTMKERCISLQQRYSAVEEENLILRSKYGVDHPIDTTNSSLNEDNQLQNLRDQVADLSRQKIQLTKHIAMVAAENRQLWSRLSQLTKDKPSQTSSDNSTNNVNTSQNLIRSKTFTQHSPNPNIRQRHIPIAAIDKGLDDLSLEEVSLKVLNNYTNSKTEIGQKCEELLFENGANSLAFDYLNDDSNDVGMEAKKCMDEMQDMKKELIRQQHELQEVLGVLQNRKAILHECSECKQRRKVEIADKSLETDLILFENYKTSLENNQSDVLLPRTKLEKTTSNINANNATSTIIDSKHIDLLDEKIRADQIDKICPLCGGLFSDKVTFDEFQDHVETHFMEESDSELSIERNFELVSHSVGNF